MPEGSGALSRTMQPAKYSISLAYTSLASNVSASRRPPRTISIADGCEAS
jgi:hypothetical protein